MVETIILIFSRRKNDETEQLLEPRPAAGERGRDAAGPSVGTGFREEQGGHPGTWQAGRGVGAGAAGQADVAGTTGVPVEGVHFPSEGQRSSL